MSSKKEIIAVVESTQGHGTLAAPPFEPLATASTMNLTVKTVFRMAVASGHRSSTIHALAAASEHIRWERDVVRLIPRPDFIAKNQSASSRPVEIFLRPCRDFLL